MQDAMLKGHKQGFPQVSNRPGIEDGEYEEEEEELDQTVANAQKLEGNKLERSFSTTSEEIIIIEEDEEEDSQISD